MNDLKKFINEKTYNTLKKHFEKEVVRARNAWQSAGQEEDALLMSA